MLPLTYPGICRFGGLCKLLVVIAVGGYLFSQKSAYFVILILFIHLWMVVGKSEGRKEGRKEDHWAHTLCNVLCYCLLYTQRQSIYNLWLWGGLQYPSIPSVFAIYLYPRNRHGALSVLIIVIIWTFVCSPNLNIYIHIQCLCVRT